MCRFHVMFIFAVLAVPLYAARVVWNRAFLDLEKPYYDTYDMIATIGSPYLTMGMNYQGEAMVLSAMPDANTINANCFDLAEKGTVVDSNFMENCGFAYAEMGVWDSPKTYYSILFNPGDRYYLGFAENVHTRDYPAYGWVLLEWTTDRQLVLLASAEDMDGDPIVVGAVPEPSGGLLLLFGAAALALRRRRLDVRQPRNGILGCGIVALRATTNAGVRGG